MVYGNKKIEFEADYKIFFNKTDPQLLAFEKMQHVYAKDDNIFLVLKPAEGDVFEPLFLTAVLELTKESWETPYVHRVDSITNYQNSVVDGDNIKVNDLVEASTLSNPVTIRTIKKTALHEPTLVGKLLSNDGRTTGINITLQLPDNLPYAVMESVSYAEKIVEEIRKKYPNIRVAMTGIAPISTSYPRAAQKDMALLTPLMHGVIIILMSLLLRSFFGSFAASLLVGTASYATTGMAGWLGIKMTPPTAIVPTIVLTIVLADSVHVLESFLSYLRDGLNKIESMTESLRVNFQPVLMTTITTISGFLSLNFSDSPPYRDLGNMAAIGSSLGFVLSIFFLPGLVFLLPFRVKPMTRKSTFMSTVADFLIRQRRTTAVFVFILTIGMAFSVTKNEINDHILENFDESFPIRVDSEFTLDNLTGIYQLEFSLDSGKPGGVTDLYFIRKVDSFLQWLRLQPEVVHVDSIIDILKRQNRVMNFDNPDFYKLPDNAELAAQYLLLYEFSLPYGLDIGKQISMDHQSTRLVATLGRLSTKEIQMIKEQAEKWLMEKNGWKVEGTGVSVIFSSLSHRNIKSMIWGTISALLTVIAAMLFTFRSIRITLVSLLPNIVPAILGFGIWGWVFSYVSTPASMVTAVTLGLIDDDTIHLITTYLRMRNEQKLNPIEAAQKTLETGGAAVLITAVLLISGFMILSLSPFKMNSIFGLLSAIIIAFALFSELLLLPFLLIETDKFKKIAFQPSFTKVVVNQERIG